MKMRVYISGKITNDPDYELKFFAAQKELEADGYIVLNPANLPKGLKNSEYMRICMVLIDIADAVYFLPGCHESDGSMLEYAYCKYTRKRIL